MSIQNDFLNDLKKLFMRCIVVDLQTLIKTLKISRRTIFRRLNDVNYISSYTHAAGYYTLPDIPSFDKDGLWHYDNIGFSKHGTLKNTIIYLVNNSKAGKTHSELEKQLHIGVQNTLLDLVKSDQITRESSEEEGVYLYLSKDPKQKKQQIEQRLKNGATPILTEWIVANVLAEIIRDFSLPIDANKIFSRLKVRGSEVTLYLVEKIIDDYGLKKKLDLK